MRIFSIVITIVGLITYIIVFNLDWLTSGWRALYYQIRQPLVDRMSQEGKKEKEQDPTIWVQRGRLFQSWEPGARNSTPSEWLVVWYGIVCAARSVRNVPVQVKSIAETLVWDFEMWWRKKRNTRRSADRV